MHLALQLFPQLIECNRVYLKPRRDVKQFKVAARQRERACHYPVAHHQTRKDSPAATVALVGIIEFKAFVQAFAHKVEFCAFKVRQAFRVDQNF